MNCFYKRNRGLSKSSIRTIHTPRLFRALLTVTIIGLHLLILGFISLPPVHAQEEDLPFSFNTINWAYATAFGTGVYRIRDDVDVFVLSMQPGWTKELSWKKHFGDRPMLLELRFPITFGVHNYHIGGIVEEFLTLKFRQVSFAPGAFLELPMSQRWALRPFTHLGWGIETSGDKDSAWIYWGGIKSRLKFPFVGLDFGLLNGLTVYGFSPNTGPSQDFSEILTGLECDIPLGKLQWQDEPLYLKTHIVNSYYLDNLNFMYEFKQPPDLSWQWELGISIGKKKSKIKLWIFQFERIGVGYSYARDARGIRFYTRSTFKR
jgi:hypothetical protein